jgi:hypothetical protein
VRSVRFPDDATLTVKTVTVNRGPRQYAVEARFVTPTLRYGVGWSPRVGFYVIAEPLNADLAGEET